MSGAIRRGQINPVLQIGSSTHKQHAVIKGEAKAGDLLLDQTGVLGNGAGGLQTLFTEALSELGLVALVYRAFDERFGLNVFLVLLKKGLHGNLVATLPLWAGDVLVDEDLGGVPEVLRCFLGARTQLAAKEVIQEESGKTAPLLAAALIVRSESLHR